MSSRITNNSSPLLHRSGTDHEQNLKIANEALKRSKIDARAQHTKVIALLNLDRYDDALRIFEGAEDSLKNTASLAWCYSLYKCGKLKEAMDAAQHHGRGVDRGLNHVEAQAAYRSEDFQRAAELYKRLYSSRTPQDSESHDLRINSGATDAQMIWARRIYQARKLRVEREDLEQFETTFNAACGYVARGDMKQADILLKRARDLCKAAEELSNEEKLAELLPIKAQQIYVLSKLGKSAEAQNLCDELEIAQIKDPTERYVAQANMLASSFMGANPYLAQRLFQAAAVVHAKNPLFNFQISILDRNASTLAILTGKLKSVASSTDVITAESFSPRISNAVATAGVHYAAAHVSSRAEKTALKELLPLLDKRPRDVGLLLTVIQLFVFTKDSSSAISTLESFLKNLEASSSPIDESMRFTPGLVAILAALYDESKRTRQSKAELRKAALYWQNQSDENRKPMHLFSAAGLALLISPSADEVEEANNLFNAAISQDPTDRLATSGLVASGSASANMVKRLEDELPELKVMISDVDLSTLENAGAARPSIAMPSRAAKKRLTPGIDGRQGKAKKPRKGRLPKAFDAQKEPDPERWLPLRDRSNWKPKGRKKGRAGMATQGGVVSEDSRPATPSSQVLLQGKSVNQSKAKKKKGTGGK